jgi:hypothetical protein
MRVVRKRVVDWEPLTLTLVGGNLVPRDVEALTRNWLADRAAAKFCGCHEKSLSVGAGDVPDSIIVDCEWMCERCLADYCRRLESAYPGLQEVRIGLDDEGEVARGADAPRASSYVDVAEKTAEMEDRRQVVVPAFRIARGAVTLREFLRFVDETGYETTAQERRRHHTFLNHPAMSPFEEERARAPVKCVSFYDAIEYCRWMKQVRLPTEYEWIAASIVDERVYDEWADRELVNDSEGRLRQMSLPNALRQLGCEWTGTEGENDTAVVRWAPQWVRFTGWRNDVNRRLARKDESSLMVGFRVVLLG